MKRIRSVVWGSLLVGNLLNGDFCAQPIPADGDEDGGASNYDAGASYVLTDYGTNLWLEITNADHHKVVGLIHNSSSLVPYAIRSKQALPDAAWSPASTVYGDQATNRSPFSVPMLERDTLFLRAQANVAPRAIGAGYLHKLAVKRDGTVLGWGISDDGELGNGTWNFSLFPSPVIGLSNIVAIAVPEYGNHALALDTSGTVWSWGMGWYGQLGRDDGLYEDENTAALVPGLSNIVAIAGGYAHSMALKSDGTVWTWGYNGLGELGDGTTTSRDYAAPVPGLTNVIAVASGPDHSFALCADGTVRGWGYNHDGELGIGNTINQLQPVLVNSLSNVVVLAGGDEHSLALLSDGTVMAWGYGRYGELGNGAYTNSLTPVAVSGLSNIVAIASGGYHNLALDPNGTLWEWGDGEWGQLGNGVEDTFDVPFVLDDVSNVVAITAGEYNSMVMTADGKAYQWGIYGYLDSFDWREQVLPVRYELYNLLDSDGDGLPDWFETIIGTSTNNADSDGDGVGDYVEVAGETDPINPSGAPQIQLGFWKFDTTNWLGDAGQTPLAFVNLQLIPDWRGNALRIGTNTPAWLVYREMETNISHVIHLDSNLTVPQANCLVNITLPQGTIRFWFRPDWGSTNSGGTGPGTKAALIAVGSHSLDYSTDFWGLEFDANGNVLRFSSEGGGQQHIYCEAPVSFSSNKWCQVALTYNASSSVIYTNGQSAAAGTGVAKYPDYAARQTLGFNIGSDFTGGEQAFGLFDDLETFNYPMSATDVNTGYYQSLGTPVLQFSGGGITQTNTIDLTIQGVPDATVAVLVNDTDFAGAIWQTYFNTGSGIEVPVTLDSGDGAYTVSVGIWNGTAYAWTSRKIVLDKTPPVIVPGGQSVTTNFPLLQLTGYATEALSSIAFDVVNNRATNLDQTGFIVQSDGNTFAGSISTNRLQCFDIKLAPGLNTITLRCADLAGNISSNVYSYTLDTSAMSAPTLSVDWPSNNAVLSGNAFTLQGHVSDPTAIVVAQVTENGSTNEITGVVERDGRFWIDNVPLATATNFINLTATDVAGNSASAAITVQSSPVNITVDPMSGDALKGDTASVSGTIGTAGYNVTVNGVAATVNGDGTWSAANVPVSAGGVAAFRVQALASGDPEVLAVFDKPTFIRVSSYREKVDGQYHFLLWQFSSWEPNLFWFPDGSVGPLYYNYYYDLIVRRSRHWTNGLGGIGMGQYGQVNIPNWPHWLYFDPSQPPGSEHFWFPAPPAYPGIPTTCQISYSWPAEPWPPSWLTPDAISTNSCGDSINQTFVPLIPWEHFDYGNEVNRPVDAQGSFERYQRTAQTRLELVVGGRALLGPIHVVLKAGAKEFSRPDRGYPVGYPWAYPTEESTDFEGDTTVPPGNIQINGLACKNGDGTNGFVTITVPAGTDHLDITPLVGGTENDCYSFAVTNVDFQMVVDNNRDGQIDFGGSDATASGNPYHFWVNDSEESGDIASGSDAQIPGSSSPNCNTTQIQGRSDLVNFFPVALCMSNAFQLLPPFTGGYEYHLVQDDAAVKFVYTSLSPTNAFDYLTNTASYGYGVNGDKWATNADTIQVASTPGTVLDPNWLAHLRNNGGTGVILMEGGASTTRPLWLEFWRKGKLLGGTPLYLSISGVEQMYRHASFCYINGTVTVPARADAPNEPRTNGKNLVFLHGYNVNQQQARGVESEIFKRFYWSSSKASFYGVTWNGAESQWASFGFTPNYHTNVVNALDTASAFANFINNLSGGAVITAHSLGNMVVLSAISDFDALPSKYFMIDAAVPMEAIQGNATPNVKMIYPDWISYANRLYASDWWQLFTNGDARSTLTWNNRLANLGNVDIYNFYSGGEEVLREWTGGMPPSEVGGSVQQVENWFENEFLNIGEPVGTYVWAWQEILKGRGEYDGLIGSIHGGWEFNYFYYTNDAPMPPGDASLLSNPQLQTNAFFDFSSDNNDGGGTPGNGSFQTDMVLYSSSGSVYAQANRDRILSDAIPALTLPVGANPVPALTPIGRNFDMQVRFETGWPSSRGSVKVGAPAFGEWHHSDFDCVAYPFTHQLFDTIVNGGNLH